MKNARKKNYYTPQKKVKNRKIMQVDWNHDNEVQFYSGFTAIILYDKWDKSNDHIYVNFQLQLGINWISVSAQQVCR